MQHGKVLALVAVIVSLGMLYMAAMLGAGVTGDASTDGSSSSDLGDINSGVSRFLAGNTADFSFPLKLMNPTGTTQVAAVLVYQRLQDPDGGGGDPGEFLNCVVRELIPHAAIAIDIDFLFPVSSVSLLGTNARGYVEIISSALGGGGNQMSDDDDDDDDDDRGPGIIGDASGFHEIVLIDPDLFELPADAGADECVCEELNDRGLPLDLFEDFGIDCFAAAGAVGPGRAAMRFLDDLIGR